jgi:hypothetical protein
MDFQALKALQQILRSTLFLLQHYKKHVDWVASLGDVEEAINRALREMDAKEPEQAAD